MNKNAQRNDRLVFYQQQLFMNFKHDEEIISLGIAYGADYGK